MMASTLTSSLSENDVSALARFQTVSPYNSTSQNDLIPNTELQPTRRLEPLDKLPPIDVQGFRELRRASMPVGMYSNAKINKAHVLPIRSANDRFPTDT